MDDLLQKAIERRDALRRELEAVEAFLAAYQQAVGDLRVGVIPAPQADLFAPPRRTRKEAKVAVAAMMDEAERLILEGARPLSRSELLEALEMRGHLIEGGDRSKVLGTNLWRSRRFHNIHGVGYWPKAFPIPEHFRNAAIRDSMLS